MKSVTVLCALLVLSSSVFTQVEFKKVKVTDNIYSFIHPNSTNDWIDANSTVIFGKDEVFVVDATLTPKTAAGIVEFIQQKTSNPVKRLLITHWHYDHSFGAESFKNAFPQMDIICGKQTDSLIFAGFDEYHNKSLDEFVIYIDSTKAELERGTYANGKALTDYEKSRRVQAIKDSEFYMPELRKTKPLKPSVTFEANLTFYAGGKEIRVFGNGAGHTENDVFVYIPEDRVLVTGDLLSHPVPLAFSVFPSKWIKTLKQMAELEIDYIVPGHGDVLDGKEYLHIVIKALEDITAQVTKLNAEGKALKEIVKEVDKETLKTKLAGDSEDRKWAYDNHFIYGLIYSVYNEVNPKQ